MGCSKMGERRIGDGGKGRKDRRVGRCRRWGTTEGRECPYKPMSNTKPSPHPEQNKAPQG